MRPRFVVVLLLAAALLGAAVPRPYTEVVSTETLDFAPGGSLHIDNSTGQLNIEGWDKPQVEIVVTRVLYPLNDTPAARDAATRELNDLHIAPARSGDRQITIATPSQRRLSKVELEYRIRVPRATALTIRHNKGDVRITSIDGDTDAAVRYGDIVLRLPAASYVFDAGSREGGVVSDFAGAHKGWRLIGEKFTAGATGHRYRLHATIGAIQIQQLP